MGIREGAYGPFVIETRDVTFDFASVAAASSVDQAVTVPGAKVGDAVQVTPLGTWPAGLSLPQGRVSAPDTVQCRLTNPTAGAVDPASQVIRFTLTHDAP